MIKILKSGDRLPQRSEEKERDVNAAVAAIIADVRQRGDTALLEYGRRFDCPELNALQVSEQEIEDACARVDERVMSALKKAAANIRAFHNLQKRDGFMIENDGITLGQRILPVDRAGIYVPGGTACYPSTVLMDAIPASVAGVSEIVMATPAQKDGTILPEVLAAAKLAGVTKIFKIDSVNEPSENIDMIAGPSEILIIADSNADPKVVAADMLSQAEHDVLASAMLITDSEELAQAVSAQLEEQIPQLPRADICRRSIDDNSFIMVESSIEKAIELSNSIAPEHLELCIRDPFSVLDMVKHAGSIFMGYNAPEALGDYLAGPNHTLPTSGTARFSSPLSVDDFIKKSSVTYYSKAALQAVAADIDAIARREGLQAHAKSATVRFEEA